MLACASGDEISGVNDLDSRLDREPEERCFLRFLSEAFDETLARRLVVVPSSATSAPGVRLRVEPAEELFLCMLPLRVRFSSLEILAAR